MLFHQTKRDQPGWVLIIPPIQLALTLLSFCNYCLNIIFPTPYNHTKFFLFIGITMFIWSIIGLRWLRISSDQVIYSRIFFSKSFARNQVKVVLVPSARLSSVQLVHGKGKGEKSIRLMDVLGKRTLQDSKTIAQILGIPFESPELQPLKF